MDKQLLHRITYSLDKNRAKRAHEAAWQSGIATEIAFWDDFVATGGGLWPDDFQERMDPAHPLQESIIAALGKTAPPQLKMLDVGAGPLTYLGKVWPGHTLAITAIDPLAEEYAAIFQKYDLTPPIRTEIGFAERLVEQFGENQFDLVHARNCIDHGYDPALAIEQMVAVTKPGGVVYMHHAVNEATMQAYHGFHQWNLHGTPHCLYVSSRERTINVTQRLAWTADLSNQLFSNNEWIATTIRKRRSTSFWGGARHLLRIYRECLFAKASEPQTPSSIS